MNPGFDNLAKSEELLEKAQEKYIFGKKFDKKDFCDSIESIFKYFFDEEKEEINKFDIEIYGYLFAYASLPIIKDNREFYVSQKIAIDVAGAMVHPEIYEITNDSISSSFYLDGEDITVTYNVNAGDFSEYIDILEKMEDLD